ncbi:glutamine amidotransferase [Senegalia massiliensis]|uniref:Cytoplasmic protein n=1 Tax=Senegalia massiliensis TaxID=1720316 RepID=A0A845QX97_9CLOT|nr:glutamine amidotransferase [Senegalia massiliensis]NBI07115.1 cytoplasmic protein [Senegalia massiliensis]
MSRILFAGETWFTHTLHVKGFDSFTTSSYGEGIKWIKEALEEGGNEVVHVPNHKVQEDFPYTLEELKEYDLVILSDIGSNTLLLPDSTFVKSEKNPDRCELIKEYVMDGGAFIMIGGYMAFTGIDAKSRYGETAIKDILPVKCLEKDDRVELPQGITPVIEKEHEILNGVDNDWPHFLGYNKTIAKEHATVLATIGNDPFIAVAEYGKGKSAVFTSDCAPHWGPTEFVEWKYYNKFWNNLIDWVTK